MEIKIQKLHPDARIPQYALENDAGMDLYTVESATIPPLTSTTLSTGIAIEIPLGFVGLVWDKSGLAKTGLTTLAGVFDATYRGEYKIVVYNTTQAPFEITKGQKIAQLLIQPIVTTKVVVVDELSRTKRQDRGFGSTGK